MSRVERPLAERHRKALLRLHRVVARLREVTLTALGREVAAALAAAEEEP